MLHDAICIKIKNRQNEQFEVQVRIMDTLQGKVVIKIRTVAASGIRGMGTGGNVLG